MKGLVVGFLGASLVLGTTAGAWAASRIGTVHTAHRTVAAAHAKRRASPAPQDRLQILTPKGTSFSEAQAAGLTLGLRVVDPRGRAVALPASYAQTGLVVTVWDASGRVAQTIEVDGSHQGAAGYEDRAAAGGSFTLADDQRSPDAGRYVVQVSDPLGVFAPSAKVAVQETPGPLDAISTTDPAILYSHVIYAAIDQENGVVPLSDPSMAITAQLTDAYGNPIAQAGVPINFDASGGCSEETPTLTAQGGALTQGSYQGATGPVLTVPSDPQGQATAQVTGAAVAGSYVCLDLWSPDTPDANGSSVPHNDTQVGFTVAPALAAHITASMANQQGQSSATVGDQIGMTISAEDQNGNPVQGQDVVQVTFSPSDAMSYVGPSGADYPGWLTINRDGSWDVSLSSSGTRTIPASYFVVEAAGTVTASLEDISTPSPVTAQASISVRPGPVCGFAFFDKSGKDIYSGYPVPAGKPLPVTIAAIDAQSDSRATDANYIVSFTYPVGQFRLSPGGRPIGQVTVPAGSSGVPMYFVSPRAITTYMLGWHAWTSYPSGSSLSLRPGQSVALTGDGWQGPHPATATWAFSGSHAGSLAPAADNGLQDTYTAPATGQGTDAITYQDPGGDKLTVDVSY